MCVSIGMHVDHGMHVEVRGQPLRFTMFDIESLYSFTTEQASWPEASCFT